MMSNAVVKMLSTVHLNYAARTLFILRIDLVLFVVAQVKQIMFMLDVVETKHTMLKHKSVVITTVLLRSRILGQKAVVMALIIIETKMCAAALEILNKTANGCCKSQAYDLEKQGCCSTTVYVKSDANSYKTVCCNGYYLSYGNDVECCGQNAFLQFISIMLREQYLL